jgi:hypothetical protein
MTTYQDAPATTPPVPEQLCLELRGELRRLGVELPALTPLAGSRAVRADDGEPSPLIWLGTCDAETGRRLLDVLRGCGA